ncbi:ribosomal subunit 39S-domain-containing protein [Aspergillus avenaceus]|uniref:Large ribosomal subunit protein mL50 n=1 Tax=Aspergillus avenaceus TaxID=36643 RepID=A0A5N6U2R4_ASPAV|nr:ribosomal subunit 39S-domain-containing protein [Aspergillus avenaceus]
MRSSLRLLNLEAPTLQGSKTLYVCSVCRQETRPRPALARQFLRNSSTTPITERVRRKIWGTDSPPGLEDPYGGQSVLEKKFKKDQPEQRPQRTQEPDDGWRNIDEASAGVETAPSGEYEPATTWEGLARVGHLGRWTDFPASEVDEYTSFKSKKRLTKPNHHALAAHQAAVEICLMQSLNKPLASVCDVVEHQEPIFDLLWKCRIKPADGQWNGALVYPDEKAEQVLAYVFEQIGSQAQTESAAEDAAEADEAEPETVDPEAPRSLFFNKAHVRDKGYLRLSLADPATKFAFLKRFSQLTGHYFPDPVINSISSVREAIQYVGGELSLKSLKLDAKPQKLGPQLTASKTLQDLPNVKVFEKRQKRVDRDEELGRKKVIEAALRERGLIQ